MNLTFKVFETSQEASKYVAEQLVKQVQQKPKSVLGLATGSTPIETYRNFIKLAKKDHLNLNEVSTFNLDEYVGLSKNHDQSYQYFMNHHLFKHLNFDFQKIHFPNDKDNYGQLIQQSGGIDLQILGVGTNGHIGFNEPGSELDSKTRIVNLAESTIRDNARFFNSIDEVPKKSITMGIETILQSKKIYLLAFGTNKKTVIAKLKKVTKFDPNFPVSALVLHPHVEIVLDQDASA